MPRSIGQEIDAANQKAVDRIIAAEATLDDMKLALKAIPRFKADLVTYAGPPITWALTGACERTSTSRPVRGISKRASSPREHGP